MLKTILVYGIVGIFMCLASTSAYASLRSATADKPVDRVKAKTFSVEIKTQTLPVDISFEGVVLEQNEFLSLHSDTSGIQFSASAEATADMVDTQTRRSLGAGGGEGKVIIPAGFQNEIHIQVGIQSTTSEIPQLNIQCSYCRVKFRNLPIHVTLSGRSFWVTAHQMHRLDIVSHSVVLLESSAVSHLSIDAQQLDTRQALVAGQVLQAKVAHQCEWGGSAFEVSSATIECAESIVFNPAKVQCDELRLSGNHVMLQLWDATVAKVSLKADHVLAWFYDKVQVASWVGAVNQARVFSVASQASFKRDAGYPLGQFAYFNDASAVSAQVSSDVKKGPLTINSGFFMRVNLPQDNPQDLTAAADKKTDEQASKNNPHASTLPQKGVY